MELSDWFKGFEKGIARLSPEQRSAFFSECGKNCVDGGTLSIYRKLYEDAGGDMDVFLSAGEWIAGSKRRGRRERAYLLPYWNVLAICARKAMSQRLYSVNVPVRVSSTLCKAFGKGGIFR